MFIDMQEKSRRCRVTPDEAPRAIRLHFSEYVLSITRRPSLYARQLIRATDICVRLFSSFFIFAALIS